MKHILFFADGTWNSPDKDDNHDGSPDPTNVYKLFLKVSGQYDPASLCKSMEQEVRLQRDGATVQVAKYIYGVGGDDNPINQLLGGAFGAGVIKRIVRGYTFISRNYKPGDRIHLIGFSRGAYTARALGGLLLSQGVLRSELTDDPREAYINGTAAWYRYREASARKQSFFGRFVEALTDLPNWLDKVTLNPEHDLIPVRDDEGFGISSIAVWDTVGALGIPEFAAGGQRVDTFQFADNKLSDRVKKGFHAVSRDEQRVDFTPTLWAGAANVEQMLFAGAHADVGGGYPMLGGESGLSDIALEWMQGKLAGQGVKFDQDRGYPCEPASQGIAHQPWLYVPFRDLLKAPRELAGLQEHASIDQRRKVGDVRYDPSQPARRYQ